MSRNMIEANRRVFSRLIEKARLSGRTLDDTDAIRYIKTSAEEREWLKNLVVNAVEPVSAKVKTATIDYDGRGLLVVVGAAGIAELDYVMKPMEVNAGMFTALVGELDIPVRESTSPLEIIETALAESGLVADYVGHESASVAGFFEPIVAYEIAPESPIPASDLLRLSCFWALKAKETVILPFSEETLNAFESLLSEGIQNLPSQNLLRGVQCAHWQHAFLEVYRCIERLFAFQHIENLHKELALAISLLQFATKLEKATGWRPREEDAIERLLDPCPPNAQLLFDAVRDELLGDRLQGTSRWIYDLRNSVVHFRPALEQAALTNSQWDRILRATVFVVGKLYSRYDAALAAA